MRRIGTLAALMLAAMVMGDWTAAVPAGRERVPELSLRIVPAIYRDPDTGRSIWHSRFRVVVTNHSLDTVRIWKDWSSWGYFNLSFTGTDENGKSFVAKRKDRSWDKNYPDWLIVPPGDHMIFEVDFHDDTWQGLPRPPGQGLGNPRKVRMRAVYEVEADKYSAKHGIWTGRISSPEEAYSL